MWDQLEELQGAKVRHRSGARGRVLEVDREGGIVALRVQFGRGRESYVLPDDVVPVDRGDGE